MLSTTFVEYEETKMNKKSILIAVGLLALFALNAHTQQSGFNPGTGQGGFVGPSAGISTVAQALTMRDDAPVILQGKIQRFLGNERYLFSDNTGSITIEIERRVWGNVSVDENDTVEISGEIDRDRRGVEVEVKSIRKL
jgi:uncharacterized protein (TIGR00156 family)